MHVLGIEPEPNPGVVTDDLLVLRAQLEEQVLERYGVARRRLGSRCRRDRAERALDVDLVGVPARAGVVETALEHVEQRLVTGAELNLELVEAVDLSRAFEDRDRIRHDVGLAGAVAHPDGVAARSQGRGRPELAAAEEGGQQLEELLRRHGAAVGLDLEAPGRLRQRQLPAGQPLLDAAAQPQAAAQQAPVGGVEVGGREDARLEALPFEQLEELGAAEELPFAVLPGTGAHGRIVRRCERPRLPRSLHQTDSRSSPRGDPEQSQGCRMPRMAKVLIVEDDAVIAQAVGGHLRPPASTRHGSTAATSRSRDCATSAPTCACST